MFLGNIFFHFATLTSTNAVEWKKHLACRQALLLHLDLSFLVEEEGAQKRMDSELFYEEELLINSRQLRQRTNLRLPKGKGEEE